MAQYTTIGERARVVSKRVLDNYKKDSKLMKMAARAYLGRGRLRRKEERLLNNAYHYANTRGKAKVAPGTKKAPSERTERPPEDREGTEEVDSYETSGYETDEHGVTWFVQRRRKTS